MARRMGAATAVVNLFVLLGIAAAGGSPAIPMSRASIATAPAAAVRVATPTLTSPTSAHARPRPAATRTTAMAGRRWL